MVKIICFFKINKSSNRLLFGEFHLFCYSSEFFPSPIHVCNKFSSSGFENQIDLSSYSSTLPEVIIIEISKTINFWSQSELNTNFFVSLWTILVLTCPVDFNLNTVSTLCRDVSRIEKGKVKPKHSLTIEFICHVLQDIKMKSSAPSNNNVNHKSLLVIFFLNCIKLRCLLKYVFFLKLNFPSI